MCEPALVADDETKQHIIIARRKKNGPRARPMGTYYDACVDYGTADRPHLAHGRCKRCDDQWRYQQRITETQA